MVQRAGFHMKMSFTYSRPESEVEFWARLSTPTPDNSERSEDVKALETCHDPLLVMTCTDQSGMKAIQCTNDSSSATSCACCSLRCPEAQLCLQHFALPSFPPPLPWPCNTIPYLLRRGEKGWRGRGMVECQTKTCAGRTGLGSITPKGKSLGWEVQGSSVFCCCTPLPLPELGWVRGRDAWKHPNLLSKSRSLAAAEDRTSSTAWKEWMRSERWAVDARLRCLMPCQGRAWAPWVTGMSVCTQPWEVSRWLQLGLQSPWPCVFLANI